MGSSFVTLGTTPVKLDRCTDYKSSAQITRYFCSKCGTHCFVDGWTNPAGWRVNSGCVEEIGEPGSTRAGKKDIIEVQYHGYVSDTGDGGIAGWLKSIGERTISAYDQAGDTADAEKIDISVPKTGATEPVEAKKDDRLLGQCHCGGVQFYVTRSKTKLTEAMRWFKANETHFRTAFCVCRSCRLAIGQPLQPWTFVEKQDLHMTDGSPMDYDNLGTLKQFESTPGVRRHFCGRCGATVFFTKARRLERTGYDVVDVSVGILRSKAGSRAEEWLGWDLSRVSFPEDALDEELVHALTGNGKALIAK